MTPAHDIQPLILFDGYCNLCNSSVQFIIARDPGAKFHFSALDSAPARIILEKLTVAGPLPDSMVLIEDNKLFTRSTAALRIARRLRLPWPLLYVFVIIPRPIRDWLYDIVARNRYRWFGRRDTCMTPRPDLSRRFLQ